MAALYAEGLIDKEYPTNKSDKRNEKIVNKAGRNDNNLAGQI